MLMDCYSIDRICLVHAYYYDFQNISLANEMPYTYMYVLWLMAYGHILCLIIIRMKNENK